LEEEPTRALAREARGLAEEEEESPQAAAPETRSRIAMAHRCSSHSSATVLLPIGGACFDGLVGSSLLPPHSWVALFCYLYLRAILVIFSFIIFFYFL